MAQIEQENLVGNEKWEIPSLPPPFIESKLLW